ncbi:MAG TPA: patatin-like phospholipase family protein [Solirubrobacteraceae bacterium]|jgi:NTE family protein|nr:patatin-like phospholipase family protein [Solirubrobacteraceae bacterium]
MRVGLVLGAGGVQGGAWLTGGLHALAGETGWDPATADYLVGTSAGAMLGALLACGVPPWFMVAHSAGETFAGITDARGRPASAASRSGGAVFRLAALPRPGPGSWGLISAALRRPGQRTASALLCGALPAGVVSTEPLKDTVRRACPDGWVEHSGLWLVACDYSTGRRVVFGRPDAPAAALPDAVAASCAIPGFYQPVSIAGGRYVDGGLWSTSNLDLLAPQHLDLVICLNPTSSLHPPHAWNPADRMAGLLRSNSGRLLGREARLLREHGTRVVLIQPTRQDLDLMGPNLMSRRNRHGVIELAIETVSEQLRDSAHADALARLPQGRPEKIRRPSGPPESWPILDALRTSDDDRRRGAGDRRRAAGNRRAAASERRQDRRAS